MDVIENSISHKNAQDRDIMGLSALRLASQHYRIKELE